MLVYDILKISYDIVTDPEITIWNDLTIFGKIFYFIPFLSFYGFTLLLVTIYIVAEIFMIGMGNKQ